MKSPTAERLYTTTFKSPVGGLHLISTDDALIALVWRMRAHSRLGFDRAEPAANHALLVRAVRQLEEYFDGQRKKFDLPLEFRGTDFQRRVWSSLCAIPYGQTRTCRQIAEHLGDPKAVRAVGAANGANPVAIIAPCHRVIGSSGSLTGFGGGLEAKAFLLALEASQRELIGREPLASVSPAVQ